MSNLQKIFKTALVSLAREKKEDAPLVLFSFAPTGIRFTAVKKMETQKKYLYLAAGVALGFAGALLLLNSHKKKKN